MRIYEVWGMFRIGKFGKKVVSAFIAGAVVLGTLAVYPDSRNNTVLAAATKYDSTSAINYKTILGGAVDYGIVSNEIIQNSHLETPFATNHFSNMGPGERGHNIDVDYTTSPALFLIGALDRGPLYFDYTTASEVYIEAPQSVFGDDYDPGYVVPSQGGKNGNFYFGNKFGTAPVVQAVNENASSNVNRLIERINSTEVGNKGWSDFLDKRATNPEYALNDGNNCEYINVVDQKLEIDITDSKFDGKVVYVNLTADMVQYLKESDKFRIRKNPSSIIVFNIEDSVVTDPELTLKKPTMFCDGEKLNGTTATNGHGEIYGWDPDHSANVNAAAVQKLFNETVIWNVMTKKNVRMESMGGTMLFPNSDRVTMETGNCSGWIVAKGTVDAKIQFHFLYNGTTRDSYGQMHFALRKAMTQTYAPKTSVVQDTSVSINKGDFKFYIQEYTDNTYSTTYGTKKAVSVDEKAIATFPTLSFYSDDTGLSDAQKHYYLQIPSGTEKTTQSFYFKITEDPLKTVPGIENSDGYINIELKVSLDHNKNFTYEVKYLSVTGENITYNDETGKYVKMSGVQFDLGAFYNKVNEHLGALTINKNVKLPDGTGNLDSDKTYYFTVSRVIGGTTYYYDQEGNPSTTEVKIPVTVSADTKKGDGTVSNLPEGTYTVKEVVDNAAKTVSAGGTTYTLTTTVDETSTVNVASGQFNPVSVTNNYEESQDEGSLTINKVVQGRQIQQGEEFKFRVTSTDGYDEVITVKAQNNNSNPTVTINKLPLSTYTIQEIAPVAGDIVNVSGANYRLTGVTGNNHSIELNDGSKAGILTVENTYEQVTQNLGTIAIVKLIAGITPDQANNLDPIKFTVSGPDGFSATVTYPDDFTNGRWSQSNVPHGEYTVTETANGATSTYTFVSTKVSSSNNQSQVTATSRTDTLNGNNNSTLSINFTNTYEYKAPETGALKLQKTVDGPDGCVAANTDFTFYVKGEDGMWYDEDGNPSNQKVGIKVKAGASNAVTIDPLPVQKYDITEDDATNTATENYEFVSADSTTILRSVQVESNATKTAELINKYTKKTLQPGSLTLEKTVDGPDGCVAANTEFTFYVKGENGKWYDENGAESDTEVGIKIKAGSANKVTISNIPAQKYQVYEADASSSAATGYEYLSADSTKSLDNVEVPAGGNGSATLINKYQKSAPTTGSLTLKKTVSGPDGSVAANTEFTFYVKGDDGKWYDKDGKPSDTKVGITIKAGDANIITLNDLPVQNYDITEDDATGTAAAGYEFVSGTSTTSLDDVKVKAGETVSAELINKYTRSMGGLSLAKTIDGDTDGCNATEFTFYVKGEDDKWYDKNGAASDTEVGITVPANGTVTITSIPVQKYTVTEADATGTAKTGYEFVLADSTIKEENVAVTKGNVASAELINSYKKKVTKGYIDLTKTISGDVTQEDLDLLTFTVKDSDGKTVATLKLGEDFEKVPNSGEGTKGTYKLKDSKLIEVDDSSKTYTVVETLHTLDGFDVTVTNKIGSGSETAGETATVAGASTDSTKPTEVAFKNDYTKKVTKGYIDLTKTISGDVTQEDLDNLTFTVKDSDGKTVATLKLGEDFEKVPNSGEGTKGTYKLKDSKLIEVDDSSKTYTVVETLHTLDGFDVTVTNKIGSGSETAGETATVAGASTDSTKPTEVAFKNDYTKKVTKGYIDLTKTISGDVTQEDLDNLTFTVKDSDGKTVATLKLGEDFEKVPNSGEGTKGTYKLKDSKLIEVADASKTYTVEETLHTLSGFDVTVTHKIGGGSETSGTTANVTGGVSTDSTKPTEVAFKNDYTRKPATGSLKLKKTISAPSGYTTTKTFNFYVKGESGKWYDKDGKPSDTEVYVTVPANGEVTISGLPLQKYDVTEADATATAETGYVYDKANSTTEKRAVEVTATAISTAELINKYVVKTPDLGDLTLKKTVSGPAGCTTTTKFTFYVKGEDGKWYGADGKPSADKVAITVDSTDTDGVKIENLPVQKYDITEADANAAAAAGYELDGANSEISKDDVGVVKDQETTVTLINAYKTKEVNTGSLVLKKTVSGEAGGANTTKFTFYVKGENGKWYDKDGNPSDTQVGITVDSSNADGVEVKNLPVQKYDITEKTSGTASNGYELDTANSDTSKDNVEVAKDTATTVTLTNSYKTKEVDKGTLVLSKKLTNPDGCTTTSFTFYIKGADGKWYGADAKPSADKVPITVKSTDTDGVKIENLPVQTYTVTEADANKLAADGYELDGENSVTTRTNISVTKDQETSAQLINTYKKSTVPETGSIKVSKTENGSVPSSGIPSTYSFYVKCGSDYLKADGTFGDKSDAKVFKVAPGDETEVTGLELGKTYTIEEASYNVPDGYTVSVTYSSSKSVTLDSTNKSDSVKITNTYIKKDAPLAGSLVVTKRLAGSVPSSGMPAKYRFCIKCGDQYVQNDGSLGEDKHMFEIAPNDSVVIIGLNTDNKTYQVEEEPVSNSDLPDGYKWSVVYSSESVTLKDANDSGDIEITNNYTHKAPSPNEDKGSLELKKTVSGPAGCTKTDEFTFYVKGADKKWYDKNGTAHADKAEIKVKAGETVTITGLPVQTYTITESNPANTAADGYEIDGNKSVPTRVNVEVPKDGKGEAELINVYKKSVVDTGSLILKKSVTGEAGGANTTEFTFYVKGADGKWYDKNGDPSSTQVGITVKSTDTDGVKITGLPVQKYNITEKTSGTASDGYELDTANSDTSKENVAVTKDNETTVTLINSYKTKTAQETGEIILKKTVSGETGGAKTTNFTFYVKGADGKWYDKDGKASSTQVGITVSSTDTDGVKITGIPAQKYDVTEDTDNTASDGFELDGNASETSKTGVVVTKDTTPTVTLINSYKKSSAPETGSLTLKKTVTGETGGAKTTNFTFYVKGADGKWYGKDGKASSTQVGITVSSTDTNGVTITGIPVQKYDITEDTANTASDGFELDTNNSTTSRSGVTVTATTPGEATLINSYKRSSTGPEKGSLAFSKTFGGDIKESEAAASGIYFVIEKTDATGADKYLKLDGTFTSSATEAQIKLAALLHTAGSLKWSVQIDDIPVGKYKVTEYNAKVLIDGTSIELVLVTGSSVTSQTCNVTKGATGSLDLINNYRVSDYDVKISKQDIAKKELPKATLTLTSLDGHDLSGAVVKQGSKTIKVTLSADKHSISFVTGTTPSLITGLKYGNYELKETVTPEAYLTADAIKFSIDRAGRLYDENGSVIVSGSPIVMIDKADPNYKKPTPSGNNKVPATGVGTSYAPYIGMLLLAISVACGIAVVIFRTKKRKL